MLFYICRHTSSFYSDYNLYEWEAIIKGPKDSPYEVIKKKKKIHLTCSC